MADNSSLSSAKNAKNDEFYTQYYDIEAEMILFSVLVHTFPYRIIDRISVSACSQKFMISYPVYSVRHIESDL